MLFGRSKDTVITNVVQQTAGILIFLTIPNLLSVSSFAEVTFVNVLLSFSVLADCGLSSVYARKMPALYASGDRVEIARWNSSISWVVLCGTSVFGVAIAAIYWSKYSNLAAASLVISVPVLAGIASFNVTRLTAEADFSAYRSVNSFLAITRLVAIPFVYWWSLMGWFLALTASAAVGLFKIDKPLVHSISDFDSALVRRYLMEGGSIVAATLLWLQLLYSGRLFAAMYYPDETIAVYGLINGGYQVVASLIIAAFLPVTVETYRLCSGDGKEAGRFVFRMIHRSILPVFLIAVAAAELAPVLFRLFFPAYQVDAMVLRCLLYSLFGYPLLVTLGSLFVGRAKSIYSVAIYSLSLACVWLLTLMLGPSFGIRAAAVAQLSGIVICCLLLLVATFYVFRDIIEQKTRKLVAICGQLAVWGAAYISIKTFWG